MYNPNIIYPYLRPNSGIVWVKGIEEAKAYQLSPGSNAVLLDNSVDGVMYIKTCDRYGMCDLRIFNYTEIKQEAGPPGDYITRDEFNKLVEMIYSAKESSDEQLIPTTKSKKSTDKRSDAASTAG